MMMRTEQYYVPILGGDARVKWRSIEYTLTPRARAASLSRSERSMRGVSPITSENLGYLGPIIG